MIYLQFVIDSMAHFKEPRQFRQNTKINNICEIKYSKADYSISAEEERRLQNRINDFEEETKSRNATHLTLITTFGLKANSHSSEINNVVLMDDLFT